MRARLTGICALSFALACLPGCFGGGGHKSEAESEQVVVALGDPSGKGGKVGLSALSGRKTRIVIDLSDPPSPLMRAEIHEGLCGSTTMIGVDYLLDDVVDGTSRTVVDVPLTELRAEGKYILLVRNPANKSLSGVCGNLSDAEGAAD